MPRNTQAKRETLRKAFMPFAGAAAGWDMFIFVDAMALTCVKVF